MVRTQKAILVTEIRKPVELGIRNVPYPKDGQVVIKVTATMLLPHDTYGRDWGLLIDGKLPAVLGSNVAGVIEEVGAGVAFEVGERVFGISFPDPASSDQAGLQEYALLNANAIAKVPEGFSYEQVVTLPINLVTSWTVLFTGEGFGIPPPFPNQKNIGNASASIVIIGGGTNVGQFAVQLARIAGLSKIIVVAGLSNETRLKSMGATHVIDRHCSPEDIFQQIKSITGPEGVNQVYNCASLQVELATAIIPASIPSKLRLLLPIDEGDADAIRALRPLCDFAFIADLTNESLEPYAVQFWKEVPQWLKNGEILPTEYTVVEGLEKVREINEALDAYRDSARPGPQTVVRIE